jgi:hypothetical protein
LIPFSKHFRATHKGFTDNGQGTIKENPRVMDLFSCAGYDKVCEAQQAIVKYLGIGSSGKLPVIVNANFVLAKSWVTSMV